MRSYHIFKTHDETTCRNARSVEILFLDGPIHLIFSWSLFWWLCAVPCNLINKIKIPKFILNWNRAWDSQNKMTFSDYWGEDLCNFYYYFVNGWPIKLHSWADNNEKLRKSQLNITLDEAISIFGADDSQLQWMIEERDTKNTSGDSEINNIECCS
jgi:hypothetical protein